MERNSDEFQIQSNHDPYLIPAKEILKSPVQITDLDGLVWHVEQIGDPYGNIDFCALFIGTMISFIAQFFYDWYISESPSIVLAAIVVVLAICAFIAHLKQKKNTCATESRHAIKEVRHDLSVIYEKANLPYPTRSQNDTVSR